MLLALASEQYGVDARIVALEHDADFAGQTRELLERHGVADRAEVRLAPLAPTGLAGHRAPWYDAAALADLSDIGLVLVDGPPASTGTASRYPLVPLLKDRFAQRCTIVVDDTNRPEDAEVVRRWQDELSDFKVASLSLDKGAAVLSRGPAT